MPVVIGLWCVAALLAVAGLAIVVARMSWGSTLVYGASLAASLVVLAVGLYGLLADGNVATLALPLGLPGLGAHFRLDRDCHRRFNICGHQHDWQRPSPFDRQRQPDHRHEHFAGPLQRTRPGT